MRSSRWRPPADTKVELSGSDPIRVYEEQDARDARNLPVQIGDLYLRGSVGTVSVSGVPVIPGSLFESGLFTQQLGVQSVEPGSSRLQEQNRGPDGIWDPAMASDFSIEVHAENQGWLVSPEKQPIKFGNEHGFSVLRCKQQKSPCRHSPRPFIHTQEKEVIDFEVRCWHLLLFKTRTLAAAIHRAFQRCHPCAANEDKLLSDEKCKTVNLFVCLM
ncbi:hypothetical protein MJG53_014108 [Ovis ammon polii x Ovis aries]|uniref:Uncharacterized protein n=1 Tax=Ovis ammon polii x Ovis aries TaxID=2918886 RepID=A0ACB9ULF1_9CETA|nr:hypothetical protein MJG53_014108 [Ovis ammon polii x Ovis aries]